MIVRNWRILALHGSQRRLPFRAEGDRPFVHESRLLEFFQAVDRIALFFSISHRHNSA
ncbi:MAG: hypothetical protein ACLPIC_01165 [Rhodoblastus sp.]|uniref:hypothetical protein n=1 Tax=Rhodoblastus sp. TaxID=1962975 RepID=UPI003F999116